MLNWGEDLYSSNWEKLGKGGITDRLRWPPSFQPKLYWEKALWQINFVFLFFPCALWWPSKIIPWWWTLKLRKCHVCPIATLSELPLSTGTWNGTLHTWVEPVRPLVHTDKSTYQSHEQLLLIILLFKERYQPRLCNKHSNNHSRTWHCRNITRTQPPSKYLGAEKQREAVVWPTRLQN